MFKVSWLASITGCKLLYTHTVTRLPAAVTITPAHSIHCNTHTVNNSVVHYLTTSHGKCLLLKVQLDNMSSIVLLPFL